MLDERLIKGLKETKNLLLSQQVELAKQLKEIEKLIPREQIAHNGYAILKQKRKKTGFIYCVRYYVNGKLLKTKFSLKTTDLEAAKKRAVSWKDTFLESYGKRENRSIAFYNLLTGYYAEGSELLAESLKTKRRLSQNLIMRYHNFINDKFIPYLKQEGITKAEDLKPQIIINFGGWLREAKK